MTMRNVSLTAVAALTMVLAGSALAQDSDAAQGASAAATEAPVAEAPMTEAPQAAEADATAGEEPAAAEEPEAEEPVAEEAAAEEPAAEAETAEEPAGEEVAEAAEEPHIEDISFSFEGPFGKYDQFQLQRGLQVYTEVCAACHGLRYVPLRTLEDQNGPGLPENQVRAYAANFDIYDPEADEDRPRIPTDHFPTVSGDGMGPDLSLMAKARAGFHGPAGTGISQLINGIGGPEYIHAVLTGYSGETKEEAGAVLYHNTAFAGNWIQMPEPLSDDLVTYEDGTPATVDQMARDVSAFLMWTAEPKLMDRKQVGFVSVIFLIVLSALLYLTNKKLWWSIKHARQPE
ncbi:ubiquinol-cytochrome c reductase cytochrome c1 subunit [Paracoccus halophilus]|uniref:Cytochrome c1 n=1 Tax=Paracoccus halophilus TaxID=376733 RepID=A0A099F5M8_9RHOB|nr:cytochrome C [Paracoccus halophilus]SFA47085.1 ubiquinol-cytochrome c reductase cytochrome c1 subunit [Paracoccus halophilus]